MPTLLTEVNRLKKLAGILTEADEQQEKNDTSKTKYSEDQIEAWIKAGFDKALQTIEQGADDLQPAKNDKKVVQSEGDTQPLNEFEPLTMAAGLTASAPGLISLLGKAIKLGSKYFTFGYGSYSAAIVGDWLKEKGHQLEEEYMLAIGAALQKIYPQRFLGQNVLEKDSPLYIAAHGLYATVLTALAGKSFEGAAQAHSAIAQAVEGGLGSIKSSEVAALASKITKAS